MRPRFSAHAKLLNLSNAFTRELVTCRLMTDSAFCLDLVSRVCTAGFAIEEALGSAQDDEGAVEENGEITVVQTRPQM